MSSVFRFLETPDMDWLYETDDATFLKPIYMATILSPLVLLCDIPLQMKARKKIPLFQIVNVSVPSK